MKEQEFRNWLITSKGQNPNTASSRVSNCTTIESYEGNLDSLYDEGSYGKLIERLTYTTKEKRLNAPARHSIPINGDVYNGTATYKSAANLYLEFRESIEADRAFRTAEDGSNGKRDAYLAELLGGPTFLDTFDVPLKELAADPLFGIVMECVDSRARKGLAQPSVQITKTYIKVVFNEVEADRRFPAMGIIATEVASWGMRKNSAFISVYYAVKLILNGC